MQTMTIQYNPADDETLEAVQDIKAGKVYHATSTDDLFQQILG